MHRHKAEKSTDRPYAGPVDQREPSRPRGICVVETCQCGATRRSNVNGRHVEAGKWVTQ